MSDVAVETATPFADYGCEKMIYDVRMGPQAVEHEGVRDGSAREVEVGVDLDGR